MLKAFRTLLYKTHTEYQRHIERYEVEFKIWMMLLLTHCTPDCMYLRYMDDDLRMRNVEL